MSTEELSYFFDSVHERIDLRDIKQKYLVTSRQGQDDESIQTLCNKMYACGYRLHSVIAIPSVYYLHNVEQECERGYTQLIFERI